MVKREGWYSKLDRNGKETSKWQSFPGQMFRYRAASFWARVYCPEISLGLATREEAIDIEPVQVSVSQPQPHEIINDTSEPAATKEVPDKARGIREGEEVDASAGGVHSDVRADSTTSALNPVSDGVPEAFQDNPNHDLSIPESVPTATPVAADPLATPAPLKLRDKQQLIRTVNGLPKEKVDELAAALIAEFGFDNQTQMSIQLTHQNHADFIHAFIKGQ
jgi:hypothetical protein